MNETVDTIEKEGFFYQNTNNSEKWAKIYGEIKKGQFIIYNDNTVRILCCLNNVI